MKHLIELKGVAMDGNSSETGKPITIIEIPGDPLRLTATGSGEIELSVFVKAADVQKDGSFDFETHVPKPETEEPYMDYGCKHTGIVSESCVGPDCGFYLGLEYKECPYAEE